ncbi:FadR family transcriptional regulator [Bifidobacterium sp. MA2]|uniref:FadR family transcriptional regulator n=2 Tax=Bifidobacterium santillanense TaxID=2809028 RepID=A0ABS5UQM4_9BIFI|nr:FadR family transcriptional regulator [Bifidobacterium santillanense]
MGAADGAPHDARSSAVRAQIASLSGLSGFDVPSVGVVAGRSAMRSRCDIAMDAIKSYIIREHLTMGDPLPNEAMLCNELGVSRSSVREAVRKLEALHIVSVEHGKGMFVGDVSLDPLVDSLSFRAMIDNNENLVELRNVIQVRRVLDLGVAQQVVDAMRGTEQPELEELAREMSVSASERMTFLNQDIDFHTRLLECVHNNVLSQLARSLWLVHMAVLPQLNLSVSQSLDVTAHAHADMLRAALDGDVEAYRAAVVEHYKPIEAILDSHLN